jgi:hypothetical protein
MIIKNQIKNLEKDLQESRRLGKKQEDLVLAHFLKINKISDIYSQMEISYASSVEEKQK